MNRAITNLKLEAANVGKLKRLDEVAAVYILAVQRLVNSLIATAQQVPEKYGEIPGDEANLIGPPSPENQLSERWRRCAWQLEYWLKVATLCAGEPIFLVVKLYERAAKRLTSASRTASSVLLIRRRGEWQLQIMVEHQGPEPVTLAAPAVVGIDVGIVNFAVVSPTHRSGAEESLPGMSKQLNY